MLIVNESPDNCIFLYRNENNPRYPITLVDISVSEKYHLDMSEKSATDLGKALLELTKEAEPCKSMFEIMKEQLKEHDDSELMREAASNFIKHFCYKK